MDLAEYILPVLVVMNLAAGFGCAVPIARLLCKINGRQKRVFRYFAMLIGIYFVECIAFPMGMCTQVFSVGLAFVWGIVFGLWLRGRAPAREVLKQAFLVSIYGSLPTASFCILIPVIILIGGGPVLSVKESLSFGIPAFFPWPLNTILGFFAALLIGTIVFKVAITTGEVNLLIYLRTKERIDKK